MSNPWLVAGGLASLAAAAAHALCILGGADWYRFMGAGERMARAVERGDSGPVLITMAITAMLLAWSAYALSGAGWIAPLPLLRPALVAITGVYLLRAAALPAMIRGMPDRGTTFLWVSSAIVALIGLVHAVGVYRAWDTLG